MQSQWQVVSGTWKTLSPGSPSRLFTFLGESPGRPTTMSIAFFLRRSTRSDSLGTNLSAIRWKYGSGRQYPLLASRTTSTPGSFFTRR